MAVAILVVISLPGPVRAQSSADATPVILLHPHVATVLRLPDEIEHAHVYDRDELRVAIVGDQLFVRPQPGTPAGVEALLDLYSFTIFGHYLEPSKLCATSDGYDLELSIPNRNPPPAAAGWWRSGSYESG